METHVQYKPDANAIAMAQTGLAVERALIYAEMRRDIKALLREVRELRKEIGHPVRKTALKKG